MKAGEKKLVKSYEEEWSALKAAYLEAYEWILEQRKTLHNSYSAKEGVDKREH